MVHILIMLICFGALASYHLVERNPNPEFDKIAEAFIEEEAGHLMSDRKSNDKKG